MKRAIALLLAILLLALFVLPLAAATPQSDVIAEVVAAVRGSVGVDTPGAALLLFENGERVMYEGYGYANVATRELVTVESSFELGEISSLFVCLAVARLVQDGKVEMDRDIAYYLPGDFHKKLDLNYNVTLENLLAGRAGFAERLSDLGYASAELRFDSLQEALLADVPEQLGVPNTYTVYSPFGIALAAYVVECVAKMPYEAYVEEVLLRPLGMTGTVLVPLGEEKNMTSGHRAMQSGSFAPALDGGRRYSALYPADGAVSNVADLSVLFSFLLSDTAGEEVLSFALREFVMDRKYQNGIFEVGIFGLRASANARGCVGNTAYFSAALAFDRTQGRLALVLANVESSALLALPASICGLDSGVPMEPQQQLPAPEGFVGEYMPFETIADRLRARHKESVFVTVESGVLLLGDQALVQIAPGVFSASEGERNVAVAQFVMSVEGEVLYLLTSSGEVLRPASFFEDALVKGILFVLLMLGIVYFLIGAVLYVYDAVRARIEEREYPRPWRFVWPWVLSALLAVNVLLRVILSANEGGVFASFFTANAIISLGFALAALGSFLFAMFTSFGERGRGARAARSAAFCLVFVLLCAFWCAFSF